MRILHVIATLDPSHGGPPAVALRLGAAQAGQGHRVVIAAYETPDAAQRIDRSLASIPGVDRVERLFVPAGGAGERFFGRAAGAFFERLAPDFDVLHLHGVWDTILRAGARGARRAGVPYVVVPHGMLDPWCLGATPAKRLKKRLALALVYRRMLDGAAFLHVLNTDERDLMAPLGLRAPREVIPNGVFLDEFRDLPSPDAFASQRPELAGRPYILFLSRLHPKKGLDILADAFAQVARRHPSLCLVVAGPDDGALAPLREQVARLSLTDRVLIVGPLYGRDKLAALTGAQAFCLTSRQEGFSMAITEAMACAVPVVVSRECHFPEVAQADAGRVVPLDGAACARAILDVISDESRRRAMGLRGRALVEARFTWPAIARRVQDCYETHAHAR
jgi:glycosyltransferase involved in cell wall biosynthesis